jgi:hypothetical protein
MPVPIDSMAAHLEETVRALDAAGRLKWKDARNDAGYYLGHYDDTHLNQGFYDGIAACLDVLARDAGDAAPFFLKRAAKELWALTGEQRIWTAPDRLGVAAAVLDLLNAFERNEAARLRQPRE